MRSEVGPDHAGATVLDGDACRRAFADPLRAVAEQVAAFAARGRASFLDRGTRLSFRAICRVDVPGGLRANVSRMARRARRRTRRSATERQFEKYRAAFRREGQRLVVYVGILRYLHERRRDRLAELNIAPSFFTAVIDSLLRAVVVLAHNLLIGGSESAVSLRTFLRFVSDHREELFTSEAWARRRGVPADHEWLEGRTFPTAATVRADRKRVTALAEGSHALNLLRNKGIAHFDPEYFTSPSKLRKAAPIRWSDVNAVCAVFAEMLNKYTTAYDGNSLEFKPMNMLDVEHVIEALRQFRRHRACELARR